MAKYLYRKPSVSRVILAVLFASVCMMIDSALAQDLQRGLRNYLDIIGGKKRLEQLSPQETQEVIIIHRRVQAQQSQSGESSECRDARNRAESAASELSDYSRRLRNCADAQDYNDDCSTEFRRVKSAFSDYEDAVSSVGSYCQ